MTVVIGGSRSGKSSFAEKLMDRAPEPRYYAATMKAEGEEARMRIERHRKAREGKGYVTVECPLRLSEILPEVGEGSAVLLECLGNLAANVLFEGYGEEGYDVRRRAEEAGQEILQDIFELSDKAGTLIIVTNEVNCAGTAYEGDTSVYQRLMGHLHQKLFREADMVAEVTSGIPRIIKRHC